MNSTNKRSLLILLAVLVVSAGIGAAAAPLIRRTFLPTPREVVTDAFCRTLGGVLTEDYTDDASVGISGYVRLEGGRGTLVFDADADMYPDSIYIKGSAGYRMLHNVGFRALISPEGLLFKVPMLSEDTFFYDHRVVPSGYPLEAGAGPYLEEINKLLLFINDRDSLKEEYREWLSETDAVFLESEVIYTGEEPADTRSGRVICRAYDTELMVTPPFTGSPVGVSCRLLVADKHLKKATLTLDSGPSAELFFEGSCPEGGEIRLLVKDGIEADLLLSFREEKLPIEVSGPGRDIYSLVEDDYVRMAEDTISNHTFYY